MPIWCSGVKLVNNRTDVFLKNSLKVYNKTFQSPIPHEDCYNLLITPKLLTYILIQLILLI